MKSNLPEPSADEQRAMWDDVRSEFPGDEMMQEIHFIRLVQHFRTQGMSTAELVHYYNHRTMGAEVDAHPPARS
jgi:hypothetical protein